MYTAKSLREDLWAWGEAVKHGYFKGHAPANPDTPRLAVHFGPRLPCDTTYLDLCRAFAALSPATRGLGNAGGMAWFAHVPGVSRQQLGLWLYYVDGWGTLKFRQDFKAMSPEARDIVLGLAYDTQGRRQFARGIITPEDGRGDELVAARLGISRATVYRDRNEAVNRMVAFLQPPRPAESAA